MATEREMLEFAAKACGLVVIGNSHGYPLVRSDGNKSGILWNPKDDNADCAAMCANLRINSAYWVNAIECYANSGIIEHSEFYDKHNNPETAWRYAATMVAAKIGGMK